jgi:uncharacterized protein YbaR (Trm112 family)
MITPELLAILCCPETHQPVSWASPELVAELNQRIARGQLKTRGGQLVQENLEGGLVRQDGQYLYPLRHHIPVLLIEEAIPLE